MSTLRDVVRHKSGLVGLLLVGLLVLAAVAAPVITGDPTQADLLHRREPPSLGWLFGTDQLGRGILTRVIWGARISLVNGLTALGIGATLGIVIGASASYIGGNIERFTMRVVDVLLAFPTLLLAIMTVAILGPGTVQTAVAIGVALIAPFARLSRGEVWRIKNWEFVEASRSIGAGGARILRSHIMPNVISPIVIYATLQFGVVILAEASLTFLGLGPSPPTPSWGLMVNEGLPFVRTEWWISIVPGLAIFSAVLGVNLLGDALRDVLDPSVRSH